MMVDPMKADERIMEGWSGRTMVQCGPVWSGPVLARPVRSGPVRVGPVMPICGQAGGQAGRLAGAQAGRRTGWAWADRTGGQMTWRLVGGQVG